MIIDSNKENCDTIAKLIRGMGHTPVKARSQEDALDLLFTDEFDYFILNPVIPFMEMEEDAADFENGLGLIEQIRDHYPKSIQCPIIVHTKSLINNDKMGDCMEVGVNRCIPFTFNDSNDRRTLVRTIRRLTDKALAKRSSKISRPENRTDFNLGHIHKKISSKYKLFIDLKAMAVFFNGVKVPTGKDGMQQRHIVFLFILVKNIGKPMSHEAIQNEIKKNSLDIFGDPSKSIRSYIRSTLRELSIKYPDKISQDDIKTFMKTVRYDRTFLNLEEGDVRAIRSSDEYP